MKFKDLKNELQNKTRTIKDLTRYIQKKEKNYPSYCVFLGSGCPITSGIGSGGNLAEVWRKELYESIMLNIVQK